MIKLSKEFMGEIMRWVSAFILCSSVAAWAATCTTSAINSCSQASLDSCSGYHEDLYIVPCSADGRCQKTESQQCASTGLACTRMGPLCYSISHN